MRELAGRTAFVTGGASGIGFALGRAFAGARMNVMLAVLCPGFVRTGISESARNRPERYGPNQAPDPTSPAGALAAEMARLSQSGLDPADVAARTVTAIREEELYVFTHPEMRGEVTERFAAIQAAMDRAAAR